MTKESCVWLEILPSSQNRALHITTHGITCCAHQLNYININLILHFQELGDSGDVNSRRAKGLQMGLSFHRNDTTDQGQREMLYKRGWRWGHGEHPDAGPALHLDAKCKYS